MSRVLGQPHNEAMGPLESGLTGSLARVLPHKQTSRRAPLSPTLRFSLSSLVVLVLGALGLGWWVSAEIERGVLNRSAATTALYVNSFLEPQLQELATHTFLSPARTAMLNTLLKDTPLGKQVYRFKVWGHNGLVLYHSSNPEQVGWSFPVDGGLSEAWRNGQVSADISALDEAENVAESKPRAQLLEIYAPVRRRGSDQVIAVAEFYSLLDDLEREVGAAKQRSWLVVSAITLAVYLLLIGFVKRGSDTISAQQQQLQTQVGALHRALEKNEQLSERVRLAATRTTEVNERFLRRISAELHDGPAQHLSFAALRLDGLKQNALEPDPKRSARLQRDLESMETSLQNAVAEIRAIAGDLRLPELEHLSLLETLQRAVREHERRSETQVRLESQAVPEQAPLPVKIAVYRLTQEALNNAFRHAGGAGQSVRLYGTGDALTLEVHDTGPGFRSERIGMDGHLGLAGMRERVESLGGEFRLESSPGQGTTITARLPLSGVSYA